MFWGWSLLISSIYRSRGGALGGVGGDHEEVPRVGGDRRTGWWEWLMGWAFFPVRLIISTINELTQLIRMYPYTGLSN